MRRTDAGLSEFSPYAIVVNVIHRTLLDAGARPAISTNHLYPLNKRSIPQQQRLRVNHQIRVPEVRVIDENGQNLGILTTADALRAAHERSLDLIEVSPLARPPVCRIADFGKYIYQQEKQERQNRAKQKRIDVKGIRLSLKIGEHDAGVRRAQTLKFLEAGHKVKVEMILRGRERHYGDRAKEKMREFLETFENTIRIEQPMTLQGNRLTAIISK